MSNTSKNISIILISLLFLCIFLSSLFPELLHRTEWIVFYVGLYLAVFWILLTVLIKMPRVLFILLVLTAPIGILLYAQTKNFAPPLFRLDDHSSYYTIHKFDTYYSLVYNRPGQISHAGFIGSSVYPLERYTDKKIRFSAEWRRTWSTPMCSIDPCNKLSHLAVIDILDIQLVSNAVSSSMK